MSNNVDRRIVEMEFDNKDFENNVQTSVKSLDKLKKSLNLEESAKGLSALEKAGHKFNLDGMVQAAEAVTSKFSIMGTVGDQVLRRIGDAAFNALNKMKGFVDSLTIQPISTGMQEYETQINAIQTILSNTRDKMTKQGLSDAERLEIVNDRLDQLNHYADKTIYNFTEMTRNIGTFTAAGVELDTAVQSIQGIANLAAVSGSTSEQTSRAMYQLSQAISTGTVRLLDWNSVVNAGMGGEVFQKALIRTAKAMGKTVDVTVTETDKAGKKVKKTVKRTVEELIAEEGSFRESLSKVVSGSAVDMGKKVVDSASTMLRGVDGSIFDNLDPNPTIRPVMDLTNIQNGVSAINGMFNPNNMQAIGLFRGMNLSRGINQLNLDGGRITGTITDKNIVSNLEGLQTKIEELGEAVTNMKLVLDTGALVGGTSAKMDNELGTLAMRRGRGN